MARVSGAGLRPLLGRLRRSTLAQNAASLYAVQAAGFLLPLVTLPYLARVLHPEGWGRVVFAQSFAAWLLLLVNYGFAFSATREVARTRDDAEALARTVAGVQGAKLALAVLAAAVAGLAAVAVPQFHGAGGYLAWALALALVSGFSPLWYFQGTEQLRGPALLDLSVRVLSTAAIFTWVRGPGDGWRVLAFQATGGAVAAAVSLGWMYARTPLRPPSVATAAATLRQGWPLFVFCSAASVYTTANAFVLGLMAPAREVSFYGGGERVVRAGVMLITPLSQALYPRVSHRVSLDVRHADVVARRSLVPFTALGAVLALAIVASAPLVVSAMLGSGYEPVVGVMRVLAALPVLIALGTVLGLHWALPLGLESVYTRLVLAAGVVHLCLAVALVPRAGAVGMAWAAVLSESVVEAGLVWLFLRRGGLALPTAPAEAA